MRYSMNSYFDLEENQAILFFEVIAAIRKEINSGKTEGRSYNDFIKAGVSAKTMSVLKAGKFLTWHNKKEPAWISWKNSIYENRTIANLYWEMEHYLKYTLPMLEIKTFDN